MYYLTAADVMTVLRATGTPTELRDYGLLAAAAAAAAAALARPQASAFGEDAYPDPGSKAAAPMHSLVLNHPFVDGNTRAGWNAAWTFLEVDAVAVLDLPSFDVDDAEDLALGIAAGATDDLAAIATRMRSYAVR
ncbi:type II toxin-antitoxin system death-on-curing family toxin [Georgenia yuyongxinii]